MFIAPLASTSVLMLNKTCLLHTDTRTLLNAVLLVPPSLSDQFIWFSCWQSEVVACWSAPHCLCWSAEVPGTWYVFKRLSCLLFLNALQRHCQISHCIRDLHMLALFTYHPHTGECAVLSVWFGLFGSVSCIFMMFVSHLSVAYHGPLVVLIVLDELF